MLMQNADSTVTAWNGGILTGVNTVARRVLVTGNTGTPMIEKNKGDRHAQKIRVPLGHTGKNGSYG